MFDKDTQPLLPLDERFRQAEQYAMDLDPVSDPRPETLRPDSLIDGSCPHHSIFVYGCPYCDPR